MQRSFVKLEQKYKHAFRDKINKAESPDEVGGFFKDILIKLLNDIDDAFTKKHYEFIRFNPEHKKPYKFKDYLFENTPLKELLQDSDLEAIIFRLAETAQHRYRQLKGQEHHDRTIRI